MSDKRKVTSAQRSCQNLPLSEGEAMTPLRLYRVEFTFDVMVLAENEGTARNSAEDALADLSVPSRANVIQIQSERDIPLGMRRIVPERTSLADEITVRAGEEKTVCVEWLNRILDEQERKAAGETLPLFPHLPSDS